MNEQEKIEKRRAYQRAYRLRNRERINARRRANYVKNGYQEYNRNYYLQHKEEMKEKYRQYRQNNVEKEKARRKLYYELNKGKIAEYARKYKEKNREKLNAYSRERRSKHIEEARRKEAEYRDKNRKWVYDYHKKYAETHRKERREQARKHRINTAIPKYGKAHEIVARAIKQGTLTPQPCEVCGQKPTEAHHDDYNKPLEIRWLCKACHTKWHTENQPIYLTNNKERRN